MCKSGNNTDNFAVKVKHVIVLHFADFVSKIGSSKAHVVKSKFHQKFTAKHQKSRRVPNNLQPKFCAELDRIQNEGHIKTISSCSDKNLISIIVFTVRRDQSI